MNFEIIETSRLILKGLSPEDMNYIFKNLPKPEIMKVLGHRSEEDYRNEKRKYEQGYSSYNKSFMLFLLTDKASGKIIGRGGLHTWNADHKRAEIGYVIEDESFREKGLMSEAVQAFIDYGFNTMKLNRIEALVGTGNVASLRIMEKFNFRKEGELRQHMLVSGKFEDSAIFSKLHREYLNETTSS